MAKKEGPKKLPNPNSGSHTPISLREEATGKLKTKTASNTKSLLRFDHLKKVAVWASNEAQIPSLGAFYGQHLANFAEATGLAPDTSFITCQRCETILHPGFNSTVRIEKNRAKVRHRRKKFGNTTQNNIVYKCHFCLHQNLKRGTPKGHIKGICPPKVKPSLESRTPAKSIINESSKLEKGIIPKDEVDETNAYASLVNRDVTLVESSATPSNINTKTLFEGKKRKRNSSISKKAIETASKSTKVEAAKALSTTSKRRRNSWTSLKEIAQNEHENSPVANLTIPFFL